MAAYRITEGTRPSTSTSEDVLRMTMNCCFKCMTSEKEIAKQDTKGIYKDTDVLSKEDNESKIKPQLGKNIGISDSISNELAEDITDNQCGRDVGYMLVIPNKEELEDECDDYFENSNVTRGKEQIITQHSAQDLNNSHAVSIKEELKEVVNEELVHGFVDNRSVKEEMDITIEEYCYDTPVE